jgi:hypothetical protein
MQRDGLLAGEANRKTRWRRYGIWRRMRRDWGEEREERIGGDERGEDWGEERVRGRDEIVGLGVELPNQGQLGFSPIGMCPASTQATDKMVHLEEGPAGSDRWVEPHHFMS